jgi:hypothetical protein
MVVLNICVYSGWNWFHVIFLVPNVLRLPIDFWKICAPLLLSTDKHFFEEKCWVNFSKHDLSTVIFLKYLLYCIFNIFLLYMKS